MAEAESVNGSAGRLTLGVIRGAHGVRGQVRILSFTAAPEAIAGYGPLTDRTGARSFRLTVVGRTGKGELIARLDGIADRDAAEALKGLELLVARTALPPLKDERTFYHADLIGLRAWTTDGRDLGRVRAVFDFGAGDVLEIGGGPDLKSAAMVPFTDAVVPEVDVKGGRLIVDPPPGLLEPPRPEDRDGETNEDETA